MTNGMNGRDLDRALGQVGTVLDWPAEADMASAVGERLRSAPVAERRLAPVSRRSLKPLRWGRPAWQLAAAATIAALVLFSAVLAVSPGARKAVAGWFGLRGVQIRQTPAPEPAPIRRVGEGLNLGTQVSIQQAGNRVGFRIRTPSALGPPDGVFLRPLSATTDHQVFLVYRPRGGLPETAATGVGALLSEFRGDFDRAFLRKLAAVTQTTFVRVNGNPGFWIQGTHEVVYLDPQGRPVQDTFRVAGNVLLWEEGGVTFRLESALTLKQALAIAQTIR